VAMDQTTGAIMPTIFDILYREYCRARLAEMRKRFYSGLRAMKSQKRIAMPSVLTARLIGAVARLGDSQCEASHRTG
jgi:hypothetical protein